MATVTDDPLDKKVEMTNWEQASPPYPTHCDLHLARMLRCKC